MLFRSVSFPVVSGHRDAYATSCPGNALYGQLQTLRNQAASYAASRTSRSQDLYGVLTSGTGSGQVELHAQSGSSRFASRMLDAATSLPFMQTSLSMLSAQVVPTMNLNVGRPNRMPVPAAGLPLAPVLDTPAFPALKLDNRSEEHTSELQSH